MEYAFDKLQTETISILLGAGLPNREAIELVEPKPSVKADLAVPMYPMIR